MGGDGTRGVFRGGGLWLRAAGTGAVLPYLGGEDFGGSIAQSKDGKIYLQSGKTAFWNVAVTGLENVREVKGAQAITINADDVQQAAALREQSLQAAVGSKRLVLPKTARTFTGNLAKVVSGTAFSAANGGIADQIKITITAQTWRRFLVNFMARR